MAGEAVEDACLSVLNVDGPAWEHKLRLRMKRASATLAPGRAASEPSTEATPLRAP
jgi:hypothetical protein